MAILDVFIPGRIKANLSSDLDELRALACTHTRTAGLSKRRAALWEACCEGAADLVNQLFINNQDKGLDWGLKRHRRRLTGPRLSAIYWWMLLYQLVILRNRGLDGYDKDEEFDSLREVAQDFMESLASSPDNRTVNPGPWEAGWDRQVSLEAALGLYNSVSRVFGLHMDLEARIARVSRFTSASEKAYSTNIQGPLSTPGGDA